ncbi:hypothetical protein F5Y09DRAFT_339094 [Xylaria sp. FL1042]|nr:hypothetical protein F5Y09DRAFT_339094 [Xylaria sp. FL1042]
MHFSRLFALVQACSVIAVPLVSEIETDKGVLRARAGQTYLNIGQNYANEWDSFASGIKTPAGISVYGDIYNGALNSDSQNLLSHYASSHNGYVEIGLSWKDAMTSNGYTLYQGAKPCNDIASGKYDSNLQKLAQYLRDFSGVKYLLRIDDEVSGNLFANTNPNTFDSSTFDLTAYPRAFAHVRQVISGFSIFNNDVCLPVGSTRNCDGQTLDPNILADIKFATGEGGACGTAITREVTETTGLAFAVQKSGDEVAFAGSRGEWAYGIIEFVSFGDQEPCAGPTTVTGSTELLQHGDEIERVDADKINVLEVYAKTYSCSSNDEPSMSESLVQTSPFIKELGVIAMDVATHRKTFTSCSGKSVRRREPGSPQGFIRVNVNQFKLCGPLKKCNKQIFLFKR